MVYLNIQIIKISSFGQERTLRQDYDYHLYHTKYSDDYYKFDELFELVEDNNVSIDSLFEPFKYCEIGNADKNGDVAAVTLDFSERNLSEENYYKKIENGDIITVTPDDILIAKVRPNLKKYIRITPDIADIYYTSAFIHIRAKQIPVIMYYCFRNVFYNDLMAISRQGKGYPTLSEKDLLTLRFRKSHIDRLFKNKDSLTKQILNIENEISSLKQSLSTPQEIIDEVFSKSFEIDTDLRHRMHKGMTFGTQSSTNTNLSYFTSSFDCFSNYNGIRFSVRSHTPVFDEIINIIKKRGANKIGEITLDIHNGSKPAYSQDEEIAVIKTANISNNGIVVDEAEYVSEKQYKETPKAQIKKDNVLICNIGKCSLGKVDFCNTDDPLFAATETMVIQVDSKKCNPLFLTYYLRSVFGTVQFEREYTGTTNQIHLSPESVRAFIVPSISIPEQNRIVSEIQEKITLQESINTKIHELRQSIDKLILDAIYSE